MELTCPRCGDTYDNDEIHEEVSERALIGETTTYAEVAAEFRTEGCGIALRELYGSTGPCERVRSMRTEAASALAELLGDDMDGYAAMMEDADMLGIFD